jgi:hypothetical protein
MIQAFKRFWIAYSETRLPYNGSKPRFAYRESDYRLPSYYRGSSEGKRDLDYTGSMDAWEDYTEANRSVYGSGYGIADTSGAGEGSDLDDLTSEDWEKVNAQILNDLRREGSAR